MNGPFLPQDTAVQFTTGPEMMAPTWDVTIREDGALIIVSKGRRAGRIHIEPSSHSMVIVTTDKITRGKHEPTG